MQKEAFTKKLCISVFLILWNFAVLSPRAIGLDESAGPIGSNALAVHALGQTGQNINVGLISQDNALATHEAFEDANGVLHLFNYDFTDEGINPTDHDTSIAAIVVSNGGLYYPGHIGVAPGAIVHSARVAANQTMSFADLRDALHELIENQNCKVIVTGIAAQNPEPNGQSSWTVLYDYFANQCDVVFANVAGNEGCPSSFL